MSKLIITYNEKCKHCKWFETFYKNKWKKRRCNLTKEDLTLKSIACSEFEL